jgi:ADP-ribose pyrophosphatase YjhB (NUDIX family)
MRDGHILMLERARGMMMGFWSVSGGFVDPGETPEEGAVGRVPELYG